MKKFSVTLLVTVLMSAFLAEAFANPHRDRGSRGRGVSRGTRTAPPARRVAPTRRAAPTRRSAPARRVAPARPARPSRHVTPGPRRVGPRHVTPGPRRVGPRHVTPGPRRVGPRHVTPGPRRVGPRHVSPGPRRPGPVVRRHRVLRPHVVHRRYLPPRTYYGRPGYHRPFGYRPVPYRRYVHAPWVNPYRHSVRWHRPFHYYSYLRSTYANYLYLNWIYYPAAFANGYRLIDGYPYYVYNGYRHRYSNFDQCNYQLIDTYTHSVQQSFWGYTCSQGYDACALQRDNRNYSFNNFRYSCVETFRNSSYNFQKPTYEYNTYDDGQDMDYYESDNYDCVDYDEATNTCYDQDQQY